MASILGDPIAILLRQELSDFRQAAHELQEVDTRNVLAAHVDAFERILTILQLSRVTLRHKIDELEIEKRARES